MPPMDTTMLPIRVIIICIVNDIQISYLNYLTDQGLNLNKKHTFPTLVSTFSIQTIRNLLWILWIRLLQHVKIILFLESQHIDKPINHLKYCGKGTNNIPVQKDYSFPILLASIMKQPHPVKTNNSVAGHK